MPFLALLTRLTPCPISQRRLPGVDCRVCAADCTRSTRMVAATARPSARTRARSPASCLVPRPPRAGARFRTTHPAYLTARFRLSFDTLVRCVPRLSGFRAARIGRAAWGGRDPAPLYFPFGFICRCLVLVAVTVAAPVRIDRGLVRGVVLGPHSSVAGSVAWRPGGLTRATKRGRLVDVRRRLCSSCAVT